MPKLVSNGPIPKNSLRYLFHANYDRLPVLAKQAQAGEASLDDLSNEFSDILRDVHINGFSKRTNPGRLRETERALANCLVARSEADPEAPVHILEVGGSDGVTTHELVTALDAVLPGPVTAVIGDRYFDIIRYRWGKLVEYRTPNQEPILARLGNVAVRLPKSGSRWALHTNAVAQLYMRLQMFRNAMQAEEHIMLVSPRVLCDERISVTALDVTQYNESLKDQFDVVRVCNLLNWDYFDEAGLQTGIAHCAAYLKEDGYLLISRNTNEVGGQVERGSLWQKKAGQFVLIDEFGSGSEIRALVTNHQITATAY